MFKVLPRSLKFIIALNFAWLFGANGASATELIYKATNPAFGGNPLNGSFLTGTANSQKKSKQAEAASESEQFVRQLKSRLLSSLATQVANAIFGEGAADEGTVVFDDQTVSFVRGLDSITLTITNTQTGETTIISVPIFVPGN